MRTTLHSHRLLQTSKPQLGNSSTSHRSGFTIIELLIVIVVIGILAAITLVAYNGVTNRAKVATLQSDLGSAATQLGIDNATNGVYPATVADANNGGGLKASSGTTWQYTYTSATNSYCLTGTSNSVSYFISNTNTSPTAGACPGDTNGGATSGGAITDGSPIQTITAANCPSTRTRAVDARDNHTYWVQKLADGKCWMLTNLAYAGGGTNTYGDVKSLTNGMISGSTTYTVPSYYIPSGSNATTEPTAPSISTSSIGQYGYLYNWCGAMGGQTGAACSNTLTSPIDVSVSVCPSGWRLPTGNGGELTALNIAINGGSSSADTGFLSNWFAQYSGGWFAGFTDQTGRGYYWSSTQASAASAYNWSIDNSDSISSGGGKGVGFAVRCLAN